jgi:hypothetical protein
MAQGAALLALWLENLVEGRPVLRSTVLYEALSQLHRLWHLKRLRPGEVRRRRAWNVPESLRLPLNLLLFKRWATQ